MKQEPSKRGIVAVYKWSLVVIITLMVMVNIAALFVYLEESAEIREIAAACITINDTAGDKMRKLMKYVDQQIPGGRVKTDFLNPVFRPLKPTALQVIKGGGDCAYKARAYIVLLRHVDVRASKLALYDREGIPRHAVALVDTDRGQYVVDLLFGVIYEDTDGEPISLQQLSSDQHVLRDVLQRATMSGNTKTARYPMERYPYTNVRTINWHKSSAMSAVYDVAVVIFGNEAVDNMQRPYWSEEPALMVFIGSGMMVCMLVGVHFSVIVIRRRYLRRRRKVELNKTAGQAISNSPGTTS